MKTTRIIIAAATIWATTLAANGQSLQSYIRAQPAKPVPPPSADSIINSVWAENDGACLTVWDQTNSNSVVIEHRDATNGLSWQQIITLNSTGENTRLLLTGHDRVLWASMYRWVLLDQASGTTLKTGDWNYPDLDARKLILRNDVFYIQQGQQMTGYNRDMDCVGSLTTDLEEGRWEVVAGSWLIDRRDRTNYVLRFATLNDAMQAVDIHEVPLYSSRANGQVSHLALGANASTLVVASTIEWTPRTKHFFTQVTRDGEVLWQNLMNGSEHITGSAILTNGWLLSGIDFNQPPDVEGGVPESQYLLVLDFCGWPQPRQHYYPSQRWEYVVLNTQPPRLLHTITDNQLEIFDLNVSTDWYPWWWNIADGWNGYWIGPAFEPELTPSYWRTRITPPL